MAASITGVFTIIDRATGPMRQMERQAKQTMRAIDDVGKSQDREAASANKAGRAQQNYERQTRNAGRAAKASGRDIDDHGRAMKRADSSSKGLGDSLAKLGAKFAGLKAIMLGLKFGAMAVGVTALAQAVGTLAGGVVALVPALTQAGAALAALPATVGAAIQGLLSFKLATGGVGDAIKAGITLQKQSGQSAWDAAQQHQQAADSIRQAERGVFLANRASADATRGLTEARREARRELVDMTLATKSAALAEKRAGLNVREAKSNLARTLSAPGSTATDIESARLGVQEAGLGRTQARIEARRQRADTGRATRRGAEGSDRVRMARRAVADATYEQAEATRALTRAQEQANHMLEQGTSQQNAYKEAMKDLGPSAQHFVKQIVDMRPAFLALRRSASQELFPHLSASVERAKGALPMIQRVTTAAAGVIGRNVERTTKRLTTGDRQEDMERLGNLQNRILNRILRGASNLGEGLMDLMVAAEPFTDWITETVLGWTKWFAASQKVNRQTGETTTKLAMARNVLERFGRIARNLWGILGDVLKAATPLGDRLWRGAEKATKGWANWTKSAEGAQKMREWFDKLYDPLHAAGQLAKDLIAAWARLTVRPEFTETIERLRDAVPGIEKFMNTMSSMGPSVARLLGDFADLMGALPFSPLQTMIDLLDRIVRAITWLVKHVPGLGAILSGLLLAGTVSRGLTLMGRLTGKWRDLFGMWRRAPKVPPVAPPMSPGTGVPGAPGTRRSPGTGTIIAPGARGPVGAPVRPGAPGVISPGAVVPRTAPKTPGGSSLLKKGLGKVGRVGTPAAIAASFAAPIAGDLIGGDAGGIVSGAGTGAMTGAMVGSMVPVVGTAVGAAMGAAAGGIMAAISGQKQKTAAAEAKGTAAAQADIAAATTPGGGGMAGLRARRKKLLDQLSETEQVTKHVGGVRGGPLQTRTTTEDVLRPGKKRTAAQAEASAIDKQLAPLERAEGERISAGLQGLFSTTQTGGAKKRALGRGQIVKTFKEEFQKAGPEGKKALSASVGTWMGELAKGDKSQQRLARSLKRSIKGSWSDIGQHVSVVNGQILHGTKSEWSSIGKNLEDPIEKAYEKVSTGFTDMQKAAVGSLVAMGFTRAKARKIVRSMEHGSATGNVVIDANTAAAATSGINQTTAVTGHAAKGARIPGTGLRDTVPVAPGQLAAPGELIVNRHTEARVNAKLARHGTSLGSEVAGETTPHYSSARKSPFGGILPGLARGGRVGNIGSMIAAADAIDAKHFPYLWGGGHNADFSGPYDCSGGVSAVLHAGGLLNSPVTSGALAGMYEKGPGEVTIYANPGHTYMSIGGKFWGTTGQNPGGGAGWFDGAARPGFTVRHVPLGGRASKGQRAFLRQLGAAEGAGAVDPQLIAAASTGMGGSPGGAGDAALAVMAAGLNTKITQASHNAPGGGGGPVGGNLNSWLRRALRITHHYSRANLRGLRTMAMQESGGDPSRVQDPSVNDINMQQGNPARGLLQTIPQTFNAYKLPGHDDIMNPVDNAIASIRYQFSKYGHIVGHSGYAMGGRIPDWGGWNANGGTFNVNRPTVFGAGEAGPERVTVRKAGTRAGGSKQPNIAVHIGNIEHKREGDVAKHIRREMELLAADIGLVGVDEDDD